MAVIKFYKEVSSLPAQLAPDAAYLVRVGSGFDLYVTDSTGSVAYQANVPNHTHAKSAITDLETITTTPTAYAIPKAGSDGKIDSGWIPAGGGGGDADTVDGFHASSTPQAGKLLALDSNAKLPTSITGDADTVDGQHASAFAAASHTHTKSNITDLETITTTPTAYAVPKAGSDGKLASGWLPSGGGGGSSYDLLFPSVKSFDLNLYKLINCALNNASNTVSASPSRIYYTPFIVPRSMIISQLGCDVSTAASGKYASVGIYNTTTLADGSQSPGSLLASVTGLSVGSIGLKMGSLSSNITLSPGVLYWSAFMSDGSPGIYGPPVPAQWQAYGYYSATSPVSYIYEFGSGYSLPSTANTFLYVVLNVVYPAVVAKEVNA